MKQKQTTQVTEVRKQVLEIFSNYNADITDYLDVNKIVENIINGLNVTEINCGFSEDEDNIYTNFQTFVDNNTEVIYFADAEKIVLEYGFDEALKLWISNFGAITEEFVKNNMLIYYLASEILREKLYEENYKIIEDIINYQNDYFSELVA